MEIQKTTTINIDGQAFDVTKMTQEVQDLVAYFDDWRAREADAVSELLLVRSALKELQNTLLTTIQTQREEAKKQAEALGLLPQTDEASEEFVEVSEGA